jgi:hypothetical protein
MQAPGKKEEVIQDAPRRNPEKKMGLEQKIRHYGSFSRTKQVIASAIDSKSVSWSAFHEPMPGQSWCSLWCVDLWKRNHTRIFGYSGGRRFVAPIRLELAAYAYRSCVVSAVNSNRSRLKTNLKTTFAAEANNEGGWRLEILQVHVASGETQDTKSRTSSWKSRWHVLL